MKKLMVSLLTATAVLSLAACGNSGNDKAKDSGTASTDKATSTEK